ncbi:hypothetical protein NKR19_g824 [Coniochaeta hoffmannii]|uniref:Asl1-like glycosyl hydrolase catalytic domain-containing protein n=1 Tax=Coniochaeta hoffmannii TaxID=91930 RepID=A0AA38SLJ3_9PEZI|nr:hypothetical protein NKR19_g824 [Coniochaeta hoffmannii]
MYAKNLVLLAAAGLVSDVLAVNVHRHGHAKVHQKKDLVIETEVATVTEWVTVTYDPNAPASTPGAKFAAATHSKDYTLTRQYSPQASSVAIIAPSVDPTPSSSSIVELPTTLATQIKAAEVEKAPTSVDTPVAAPTTEAPAAPAPTTAQAATSAASSSPAVSAPASSSGKKRMLAYNDPNLLSGFLGDNSRVGVKYNWGQVDDSTSQANIPFAPMLWSPTHAGSWDENVNKAIANGAAALLSFNECDNAGQANMDPVSAAEAHIKYMNPYAGKGVPISTPAITNSNNAGEGIDWLKQFIKACDGRCHFDFAACHWYNNNNDLLDHLKKVHEAAGGLPVWLTEFAPIGSLDAKSFMAEVTHELDTNSEYDFVQHYAWFFVADGHLTDGGKPNELGNAFAYSS